MSFSGDVKMELCRCGLGRDCCARAEAYGVLLYCNTFSNREIRLITENAVFASRLPQLFQRAFQVAFDRLPEEPAAGRKQVFGITAPDKLRRIINALGYDPDQNLALHINFGLLEESCCRVSFLRGAFLAGGSVAAPDKRYHLELAGSHMQAIRELEALLTDMGYAPKIVDRGASRVIYFKNSGQIEELLTLMGAPLAAMGLMNAKVEKDLRNGVNRRVTCDAANCVSGSLRCCFLSGRGGVFVIPIPEIFFSTTRFRGALTGPTPPRARIKSIPAERKRQRPAGPLLKLPRRNRETRRSEAAPVKRRALCLLYTSMSIPSTASWTAPAASEAWPKELRKWAKLP